MLRIRIVPATAALAVTVAAVVLGRNVIPGGDWLANKMSGKFSVTDRLKEYGPNARERWAPYFRRAGVPYPPARVMLVGFKQERALEVYAAGDGEDWRFVRRMPILGASGKLGPKLKEGDLQVPEGIYRIESLNPNSAYHLALRVNYPSDEDIAQAAKEDRTNLGSDIMIHGSNASVGCLAMGDEGAEDLFVLAAERWPREIHVLLCPVDFRKDLGRTVLPTEPEWLEERYARLRKLMGGLKAGNE